LLTEACAAAQAATSGQVCFTPAELRQDLRELVRATAANSSSMRVDLRRGRETEIDYLNGAIARSGAAAGLICEFHAALAHMVSLLANRCALGCVRGVDSICLGNQH
jgi:ketopantoate reductase